MHRRAEYGMSSLRTIKTQRLDSQLRLSDLEPRNDWNVEAPFTRNRNLRNTQHILSATHTRIIQPRSRVMSGKPIRTFHQQRVFPFKYYK